MNLNDGSNPLNIFGTEDGQYSGQATISETDNAQPDQNIVDITIG